MQLLSVIDTVLTVFAFLAISLVVYLIVFGRGYQKYLNIDAKDKRLKKNMDLMEKANPVGDWGKEDK